MLLGIICGGKKFSRHRAWYGITEGSTRRRMIVSYISMSWSVQLCSYDWANTSDIIREGIDTTEYGYSVGTYILLIFGQAMLFTLPQLVRRPRPWWISSKRALILGLGSAFRGQCAVKTPIIASPVWQFGHFGVAKIPPVEEHILRVRLKPDQVDDDRWESQAG